VCDLPEGARARPGALAVDHDHAQATARWTRPREGMPRVRAGLLCKSCNRMLGHLPRRAGGVREGGGVPAAPPPTGDSTHRTLARSASATSGSSSTAAGSSAAGAKDTASSGRGREPVSRGPMKKYPIAVIFRALGGQCGDYRSGRQKVLCPFHGDTRPSASLDFDKQRFTCFACGVAGDAVDLLVQTEGLSISAAVDRAEAIAGSAGATVRAEPEQAAGLFDRPRTGRRR
jgi:hypothetical protein